MDEAEQDELQMQTSKNNGEGSMTETTPDWMLRIGLVGMTPLWFVLGGIKAVRDLFKEFWNESA